MTDPPRHPGTPTKPHFSMQGPSPLAHPAARQAATMAMASGVERRGLEGPPAAVDGRQEDTKQGHRRLQDNTIIQDDLIRRGMEKAMASLKDGRDLSPHIDEASIASSTSSPVHAAKEKAASKPSPSSVVSPVRSSKAADNRTQVKENLDDSSSPEKYTRSSVTLEQVLSQRMWMAIS